MSGFSLEAAAKEIAEKSEVRPMSEVDTSFEPRKERADEIFKKVFEQAIQEAHEKPVGAHFEIREGKICAFDDNGNLFMVNGELQPNTTYELNGNVYRTDSKGRIVSCEASPHRTPENGRDQAAQNEVGGPDRKEGDQGGHIVSRDLGGDAGTGNLTAMDSKINQSDYKRMENDIKKSLDNGNEVTTKTELSYSGDSQRPDTITVSVSENGNKKADYTFDNNLDGSLMDKVKEVGSENDVKTVESVKNDVKGEVSSIKQEYGEDGFPTKTTITITYTDENGNHRIPVVINHTDDRPKGGNI